MCRVPRLGFLLGLNQMAKSQQQFADNKVDLKGDDDDDDDDINNLESITLVEGGPNLLLREKQPLVSNQTSHRDEVAKCEDKHLSGVLVQ
jgi:hypothetical protein